MLLACFPEAESTHSLGLATGRTDVLRPCPTMRPPCRSWRSWPGAWTSAPSEGLQGFADRAWPWGGLLSLPQASPPMCLPPVSGPGSSIQAAIALLSPHAPRPLLLSWCITLFLPGSPSQGTCLPASCPLPGVSATRKGAKASYQALGSSLEAFPAKHQCSAWPVAPLNSGVVPPDSACTSFPRAVPRGSSEGRQGPCSPSCEDNIRRLRGVCR